MTTTEITITAPAHPLPTFKNDALNKYTAAIANYVDDLTDNAKSIAVVLAKVMQSKCYTDDGFKSVAEYAESTFGINRTQAYRMANTAAKFYLNPNLKSNPELQAMPLNNLSELAAMEDDDIKAELESGRIKADTKQTEIRQIAAEHKPVKVISGPMYAFKDKSGKMTKGDPMPIIDKALKAVYDDLFRNADGTVQAYTIVKCKPHPDSNNITCFIVNRDKESVSSITLYYVKPKYETERKTKTKSPVKTTPGDAVKAAIAKYMSEHDGKEPSMSELVALL